MGDMSADDKWLVWMWQHYSLNVETFDSREDALNWAEDTQDQGDGSLHAIEGPTGILPDAELEAWQATRDAAVEAARVAAPKYYFVVEVLAPETSRGVKWATVDWCVDETEAQERAEEWTPRVTSDRVRVRPIKP